MLKTIVVSVSVAVLIATLAYACYWERKAKRSARARSEVWVSQEPPAADVTTVTRSPAPTKTKLKLKTSPPDAGHAKPKGHGTDLALFKNAKIGDWSAFALRGDAKPEPKSATVFWIVDKVAKETVVLTITARLRPGGSRSRITRKIPKLGLTTKQLLGFSVTYTVVEHSLTGYGTKDKVLWGKRPKAR